MPTIEDLKHYQKFPLELKEDWAIHKLEEFVTPIGGEDKCYISFSGGKDSTVLQHLVRRIYPNMKSINVNTGLEYPEIQKFVRQQDNCDVVRPKMMFNEVISKYGYPFISKEISQRVYYTRQFIDKYNLRDKNGIANKQVVIDKIFELSGDGYKPSVDIFALAGIKEFTKLCKDKNAIRNLQAGHYPQDTTPNAELSRYNCDKYFDLVNVDFLIGNYCCNEMKEKPLKKIKLKPIVGTLAEESDRRLQGWLKTGCYVFEKGKEICKPLSVWTEQDILAYIKKYNLQIASVYGDIAYKDDNGIIYDNLLFDNGCKLCTTGCQRTGCIFCGFGSHLEQKGQGRFLKLKQTHPRQYEYCMFGGGYDEDGLWKPTKEGLGMKHCIDILNNLYSKNGKKFIEY